jgi:hypothetical protein
MRGVFFLTMLAIGCSSSPEGGVVEGGDDWKHVDGPASGQTRAGGLIVENQSPFSPTPRFNVSGSVIEYAVPVDCRAKTLGACQIESCNEDLTWEQGTDFNPRSAGDLTLMSGNTVLEVPNPYQKSGEGTLWSTPEQTVQFSFAGADVPAFAETLPGPAAATLTAPALPYHDTSQNPQPVDVSRAEAMNLTWTGGSGSLLVELEWSRAADASTYTTIARCSFDASAGSGTIPSEVLGLLPVTGGSDNSFARVRTVARKPLEPGGWSFSLELHEWARNSDGGLVFTKIALR